MECRPIHYKGIDAHLLSDGNLQLLVTNYGAKIQSIRYRGKERLCQSFNRSETYLRSEYAAHFEDGEFSGFDHLFPNISAAEYPDAPWKGIRMPDHGEVWTQEWKSEYDGKALRLWVNGVQLPYRFCVELRLRDDVLELTCKAENLSPYPMKYLWCCHPLFILEDNMEISLPQCGRIINTAPGQKYLGGYLEEHGWPVSNEGRDMSRLSAEHRSCNKYYVWNNRRRNEAHLIYPDGTRISLSTEDASIPYMGVWVDELGYGQYAMRCVAPELASAALDCYEQADRTQKNSVLPPKESRSWTMTVAFRCE